MTLQFNMPLWEFTLYLSTGSMQTKFQVWSRVCHTAYLYMHTFQLLYCDCSIVVCCIVVWSSLGAVLLGHSEEELPPAAAGT